MNWRPKWISIKIGLKANEPNDDAINSLINIGFQLKLRKHSSLWGRIGSYSFSDKRISAGTFFELLIPGASEYDIQMIEGLGYQVYKVTAGGTERRKHFKRLGKYDKRSSLE